MTRLAILWHRLGPYHHARLKAAGEKGDLVAIELSEEDDTYDWDHVAGADGFRRITLFRDSGVISNRTKIARVCGVLEEVAPDVVAVPGWSETESLAALYWCARNGIPTLMISDSTAYDEIRSGWKEAVKKRIVKLSTAGFAGGRLQKEYLCSLGIPEENIFLGVSAVDNDYFRVRSTLVRQSPTSGNSENGLPRDFFLSSCRFLPKKNLFRLLEAYGQYVSRTVTSPWRLVLLGDGRLRADLEAARERLGLTSLLLMPGFKQYDELPKYYGLSKAFILPSVVEQWGLVVNEAMASGLPILVSNRCGCAPDLVKEGRNGFTFDPYDIDALAGHMLDFSSGKYDLSAMGTASQEIVSDWSPEVFADNLWRAADSATHAARKRAGCADKILLWGLARR